MRAWACTHCDELHTQNPDACRNCGHEIFRPVSEAELNDRSGDSSTPEATTPGTVGTTPEVEFDRSPDVNPDGSIDGRESKSLLARIAARLGL